jgi:hypothetical protein
VESTVLIVSFIPLFMFAILFGLFMDYEVFLLSRVREEYRRHGDNTRAVIVGIAGTGRDITAAALIIVAVFSGLVLGGDPVVTMMGVGLARPLSLALRRTPPTVDEVRRSPRAGWHHRLPRGDHIAAQRVEAVGERSQCRAAAVVDMARRDHY